MPTSPVSGLPIVQLTDIPDANAGAVSLTNALDHIIIPKYASTAARGTANPSPTEGDLCYVSAVGNTKGYYCYSGSAWIGPTLLNQQSTAFTTVWNTSTGSHTPSIGNGSLAFSYMRMGSFVFVTFAIIPGTTTSFNSGTSSDNWQLSLPFAAKGIASLQGSAVAQNTAGTAWQITPQLTLNSTVLIFLVTSAGVDNSGAFAAGVNGGFVDAVTPFTWTASSGNVLRGQFFYEC